MRLIICGTDEDGKSYLASDRQPPAVARTQTDPNGTLPDAALSVLPGEMAAHEFATAVLVEDPLLQPGQYPKPTGSDVVASYELAPGQARWTIAVFGAHSGSGLHSTATYDCNVVLSGDMYLELDDGEVHLEAGDCVVIPGSRHGWRAGAHGCTMSFLMGPLGVGLG